MYVCIYDGCDISLILIFLVGIPIIHTLQTDFLSDKISKVMGIMNGTTNFMLCKMEDEGRKKPFDFLSLCNICIYVIRVYFKTNNLLT